MSLPFAYPTSHECALPQPGPATRKRVFVGSGACFVCMPSEAPLDRYPPEELLRIRAIFKRVTAQRVDNPADAEDIVQEAFLTMAAKCPPPTELQKGLLVWGLGVLRKKVGSYYRRSLRSATVDLDAPEVEWSRCAPAPPPADSTLHHVELAALVRAILDGFTPAERAVMDLVLAGIPTSEIARQLHPESYQNIVNRAHRGRKKLFRELAKYGYTPSSGRWAPRRSVPPESPARPAARGCLSVKEIDES